MQCSRDLRSLARWCVWMTAALMILNLTSIPVSMYENSALQKIGTGLFDGESLDNYAEQVDLIVGLQALFCSAALVASLVINGAWIVNAARNAQELSPVPLSPSPGWCLGWFFIPIANLFMPYKGLTQTYRVTMGHLGYTSHAGWILTWWWIWILSNFIAGYSKRLFNDGSPEKYIHGNQFSIAASVGFIICGYFMIRYIQMITRAQSDTQINAFD